MLGQQLCSAVLVSEASQPQEGICMSVPRETNVLKVNNLMGKKHPWSNHGKVAGHGTKMSAFGRHFVQGRGAADTALTPSSHENRQACHHRGTDFCDRVMGNDIAEHGVLCKPQALGLGLTAFKIFLIISGSQQFVFCLGAVLFALILGGVS